MLIFIGIIALLWFAFNCFWAADNDVSFELFMSITFSSIFLMLIVMKFIVS